VTDFCLLAGLFQLLARKNQNGEMHLKKEVSIIDAILLGKVGKTAYVLGFRNIEVRKTHRWPANEVDK
jgi:hypothetical protein